MFTGIVEHVGILESLERLADGARLVVRAPEVASALAVGSSLAVNGCCLTVVQAGGDVFAADLSGETLKRTSFGQLKAGERVNLERPLTAGKELGGHFVQGHIDGVGRITRLLPEGPSWWLSVRLPEELGRYVAMKGSIAVDGISLTVAGWQEGIADMAIVPYTYMHTNLQGASVGDPINVECDILAKYVERLMESRNAASPSRLTIEKLVEQGF